MKDIHYFNKLDKLYRTSPQFPIDESTRIVIFSDLHLGNGGRRDDFIHNSKLFSSVLENYYLNKGFRLVLNGDIEDLYKFDIQEIYNSYKDLYNVFERFEQNNSLYKIIGNHDYPLLKIKYPDINKNLFQCLNFKLNDYNIFIYHGHQISNFIDDYNYISYFLIRYLVSALYIKNTTVSINNKKKFDTESRAYQFSEIKKIISIIGHTHRPLFESLSRIDSLQMKIERLIRKYPKKDKDGQFAFDAFIQRYKDELNQLYLKNDDFNLRNGLYNDKLLIPCLFNSGSGIGKRGVTGIEIKNGRIYLVYWFDRNRSSRYLDEYGVKTKKFNGTDYYKAVLKSEPLSYIFTRIKLLS